MKIQIKDEILKKRNSLPENKVRLKSEAIWKCLSALRQYKSAKTVMFYVSIKNEVRTRGMINDALKNKTVAVPKMEKNEIEPSIIAGMESLVEAGKFNIPEPMGLIKMNYKSIDIVIVPGVVFDINGHRIGYGFGYYDKFLKNVPKALKVGLAYEFQVIDKIPRQEHDVPVDFIITEDRIIDCKR